MGAILGLIGIALVVGIPIVAVAALVTTRGLRARVEMLERRVAALQRQPSARASSTTADEERIAVAPTRNAADAPRAEVPPAAAATQAPAPTPVQASERVPGPSATPTPDMPVAPQPIAAFPPARSNRAATEEWHDRVLRTAWLWLTEGNVPVKVGVVVLFAGVAALLKYATDQGWMNFPIELRLAGIALAAMGALAFGWRQRHLRRTFALSVQGGALGVLLMTVYAAFRLYGLLDPLTGFALWVMLAAVAAAMAVRQEARALAVLGIMAGFLAPILMSTGSGNHVMVFSFYAVLNVAIFGIAWYRNWRALNLLGFAFTFGIGTWWGVTAYRSEDFSSTLPFLMVFFVLYLTIPVLHARRNKGAPHDAMDASLVFGTPLVSFSLLAGLLEGARMPLAASALGLAGLYALLAWWLRSMTALELRRSYQVLAWGFATLSVPLALSAQATASVFALEGAALVWFGLAHGRRLAPWTGAALQVLAAACFMRGYAAADYLQPIANAGFMGALLLAVAGFASAWCHARAGNRDGALGFYLWGLLWWLVMGNIEIGRFLPAASAVDARLAFAVLTAAAAALALNLHRAPALAWTIAAALAAAIPLASGQAAQHLHPFAHQGLPAWAAYAVLGGFALYRLRTYVGDAIAWAHGVWLAAWPLAVMLWLLRASGDAQVASGWRDAAMVLPWLLAAAGLQYFPGIVAWPLTQRFEAWRRPVLNASQAILAALGILLLLRPGAAAPLPWIPLLNPLELSLLAILLLLQSWLRAGLAPAPLQGLRAPLLSMVVLLALTSVTLRAVHHLAAVPWNAAMFDSGVAQASLSLVWSVLGVAGWVIGSRRQDRNLWVMGAVLMGIVLAKLVLLDRTHLGNLPGIASFIGYGLLCTAVGYMAPAPPRDRLAT